MTTTASTQTIYCTACPYRRTKCLVEATRRERLCSRHLHLAGPRVTASGAHTWIIPGPPVVALAAPADTVADMRANYAEAVQLAVVAGEAVPLARKAWLALALAERGGPASDATQQLHDAHDASQAADIAAHKAAQTLHDAVFVAEAPDPDAARAVLAAQAAYFRARVYDRAVTGPAKDAKDALDDACDAYNVACGPRLDALGDERYEYAAASLGPRSAAVRLAKLRRTDGY